MEPVEGVATKRHRRPWVAPILTRHESLTAMTRQQYDPVTGRILDPNNPEDQMTMMADPIPGSGMTIFPP